MSVVVDSYFSQFVLFYSVPSDQNFDTANQRFSELAAAQEFFSDFISDFISDFN